MGEGPGSIAILSLDPPDEQARIIAANGFCPYAGLIYPGERTLTVQAHPEFSKEYVSAVIQNRVERIGEAKSSSGLESLNQPTQSNTIGRWISNFLERMVK